MRTYTIYLLLFLLFQGFSFAIVAHQPVVHVDTTNRADGAMKLFVGIIGKEKNSQASKECMSHLKRCLEHGGKFSVSLKRMQSAPSKKSSIQKLFKNQYDCALFITFDGGNKPVEWRLYDTLLGTMIKGKRQQHMGTDMRNTAYTIATVVLHELTAEHPPFLTKIAYRKRDNKKKCCFLCITDFDGTHEEVILSSRRIIVAPEWNVHDSSIFFSEFTPSNVRLMACDLQGRKRVVLDLDGTTVGISYAPWSDEVVYCRSGALWRYSYDAQQKKGIHRLVIKENFPCANPILTKSGDIIYCCRGKIKLYQTKTGKKTILTPEGYAVGPAYCSLTERLVYSKRIGRTMQLFVYDMKSNIHRQITRESSSLKSKDYRSDKTDACWSPCGTYCAFCWGRDGTSRIALINVLTGDYQFITDAHELCSYPSWSPNYDVLPSIA